MDKASFIESGMNFGDYDKDKIFQFEKCIQYQNSLRNNGVKICEFMLLMDKDKNKKLIFVEAKSSCPNSETANGSHGERTSYEEYVDSIVQKMRNSVSFYASILLKRCSQDNMPFGLLMEDLSGLNIVLLLIVKNASTEWLIPIRDDLKKRLTADMRIWNISNIFAINELTAKEKRLVK